MSPGVRLYSISLGLLLVGQGRESAKSQLNTGDKFCRCSVSLEELFYVVFDTEIACIGLRPEGLLSQDVGIGMLLETKSERITAAKLILNEAVATQRSYCYKEVCCARLNMLRKE
jgi:hypothetical protein